jgi:predicted homoserine dehydrogenase-like protein
MNLSLLLQARQDDPMRVAVIGAGKFGSMFLAQAPRTPGLHVAAIVDLDIGRVRDSLARIGWPAEESAARDLDHALASRTTWLTDDVARLWQEDRIDLVIEATGNFNAAVEHVLAAFAHGKHVVMVTVEADAVIGPLLHARAEAAGRTYAMAYGDQPALICELVDWARTCGFQVTCAGKGTKYLPAYHASTPETVWGHYGFSDQQVASGDYNARMFNSFLDGTKSAIEMAAVANATGLAPQDAGLLFPPCPADRLASVCCPASAGGVLERSGTVEVVSSLDRDGNEVPRDLRWGVYVTFETDNPYVTRCFAEYGVVTDPSGRYAALYRPTHFIGLELGYSVAWACLRGVATGSPREFLADVAAVAKRNLRAGEVLDGEGGYTVYGKLMPAPASVSGDCLPLGLAHGVVLARPVAAGAAVRWGDLEHAPASLAATLRRELVAQHAPPSH